MPTRHGATLGVVVVGDAPLDERLQSALSAAREAMVNAARHSGAPRVDVYGDLTPERLGIFVRDTGRGFDRDHLPGGNAPTVIEGLQLSSRRELSQWAE